MSMSAFLSPGVINARPLTPPNEVHGDIESALRFLREDVIISPRITARISQNTPPNSSPFRSSPIRGKKVDFHPTPTVLATPGRRDDRPQLRLKSILKTSSPLPTPDDSTKGHFLHDQEGGVLKMLDSAVQHLDGIPRDARLDAYLAINGALAAYDDMPTIDQWRHHLRALQHHVSRDIKARDLADSIDTNIAIQAIKLAVYMVNNEQIATLLEHDFQPSVLDKIITALDDSSKQITKTCLGFVSQQRMQTSIFTTFRVEKILAALNKVDNKSRGTVIARLLAFRKLVDQVPSTMLLTLAVWLPHLFNGMLSDLPEVRNIAIDLSMHVAILFGKHVQATEVLHDLLESESEGIKYFEHFTISLANMLKIKNAKLHVPQIWTVVVLMHRNRRFPIHTWKRFRAWLLVLQECMNCSEVLVKQQANLAWRKLVYIVQPDAKTPERVRHLLREPIRSGFAKSGSDRAAKQSRQYALDSYYNLLHYALRPGLQHQDLDVAWSNFVADLLQPMILASSKGRSVACAVLSGLQSPNTGSWNADAVLEDAAILPQDLPRLDPRWVRSRVAGVLKLVEPIFERALLANEETFMHAWQLWDNMMKSVIEAGAQEVKASSETKAATSCILNTLRRLWLSQQADSPKLTLRRLCDLLTHTIKQFGPSLMSEDFLTADVGDGALKVSTDPQPWQSSISPLKFLLCFAVPDVKGDHGTDESIEALKDLIQGCMPVTAPSSQRKWIETTWASLNRYHELSSTLSAAWSILADLAITSCRDDSFVDLQSLEVTARTILAGGFIKSRHPYAAQSRAVLELTSCLLEASTLVAPHNQSSLMIESIASSLLNTFEAPSQDEQCTWSCVKTMLTAATWPESRDGSFPFQHLVHYLVKLSHSWYTRNHYTGSWNDVADLLNRTTDFADSSPLLWRQDVLASVAEVLTPWIEASSFDLTPVLDHGHTSEGQYCTLVTRVLQQVLNASLPVLTLQIRPILPYLDAAFSSKIVAVVEAAIGFWNRQVMSLPDDVRQDLPDSFATKLYALSTKSDLQVPQNITAGGCVQLPYFEAKNISSAVLSAANVHQHLNVADAIPINPINADQPPVHADDHYDHHTDHHQPSIDELEKHAFKYVPGDEASQHTTLYCDPSRIERNRFTVDHDPDLDVDHQVNPEERAQDDSAVDAGPVLGQSEVADKVVDDRIPDVDSDEHTQRGRTLQEPQGQSSTDLAKRAAVVEPGDAEIQQETDANAAGSGNQNEADSDAVANVVQDNASHSAEEDTARKATDNLAVVARTRRKTLRTPRLRHDDSQIDFAPIATVHRVEPQLFTDHQREVRTRQHDDAAQYPSLSSSPIRTEDPISLALSESSPALLEDLVASSPALNDGPVAALPDLNEDSVASAESSPTSQASARSAKRKRRAQNRSNRAQLPPPVPTTPDADAQLQREAEMAFIASQASDDNKRKRSNDRSSARKRRRLRSDTAHPDSPLHQQHQQSPRKKRRSSRSQIVAQEDGDEIIVASRSSQLSAEIPSSMPSPAASEIVEETSAIESSAPSTNDLLGRLKGVLTDLRKATIPADAERNFDDLLFSLRQAAFEAGRRGRM